MVSDPRCSIQKHFRLVVHRNLERGFLNPRAGNECLPEKADLAIGGGLAIVRMPDPLRRLRVRGDGGDEDGTADEGAGRRVEAKMILCHGVDVELTGSTDSAFTLKARAVEARRFCDACGVL